MNLKRIKLSVFAIFSTIAILAPVSTIIKQEKILRTGLDFKFVAAPIDPYDPFRGRYLTLAIKQEKAPTKRFYGIERTLKGYAIVSTDSKGFAYVEKLTTIRPKTNSYFKTELTTIKNSREAYFDFPIKRYYINEKLAKKAEIAYREMSSSTKESVYLDIKVKNGEITLQNLMVNNKTIEEHLK